jgi:hypothetical protein
MTPATGSHTQSDLNLFIQGFFNHTVKSVRLSSSPERKQTAFPHLSSRSKIRLRTLCKPTRLQSQECPQCQQPRLIKPWCFMIVSGCIAQQTPASPRHIHLQIHSMFREGTTRTPTTTTRLPAVHPQMHTLTQRLLHTSQSTHCSVALHQ